LEDFFYSEQDKEKIHKILYQAGKLIRFMHEQNLCHRDLKSQNFMVTKQYKLLLIDLDGLRVKKYISTKRRKKNLARLMRSVLLVKHMGEKEQKILQQGYQSLFYNAYIT
jgi:tRNA A-37 threonylcarbamoyl transferase component Bud32